MLRHSKGRWRKALDAVTGGAVGGLPGKRGFPTMRVSVAAAAGRVGRVLFRKVRSVARVTRSRPVLAGERIAGETVIELLLVDDGESARHVAFSASGR